VDTVSLQEIEALAQIESARLHHYFIGVEHLFVALTQLDEGLTVTVMEHHGLSPRFVRYSIRESIGRYEDRRYWPDFPETPRAVNVLQMAKHYAGLHNPTERDVLLAILDEGDSIVIRVLHQIGADIETLRRAAANWTAPLRPLPRKVPIEGDVALDEVQVRVLQVMFREYGRARVLREVPGGGGAKVLLVRPVRMDGQQDGPVVAKLDDCDAILYERWHYDRYVRDTLSPGSAQLSDAPVVPENLDLGGLKYMFVGRVRDAEPMSLREFAFRHAPQALSDIIAALFEAFGPAWWFQRVPYRFGVWREYEHVLPPALVLEAASPAVEANGPVLKPLKDWSRANHVMPGEIVTLNGFTVQKVDLDRDVLYLAAGGQPESINRASKVKVCGLQAAQQDFFRGQVVERVSGRVVRTRADLLLHQVQQLEPAFDLHSDWIPSGHDTVSDLPNPLMAIGDLLNLKISGYLSTIHGNLHLGNVLVGPQRETWLIDFAWAREGHTLFDWAMLEVSLLVEVVAHLAPTGWEGVWGTLGWIASINRGEDRIQHERHRVGRALTALLAVRDIVRQCLRNPGRWDEYYVALALVALRLVGQESKSVDARRLAFLVSALSIAEAQSSPGGGEHAGSGGMTGRDRARREFGD
jgi:hypothetical protein